VHMRITRHLIVAGLAALLAIPAMPAIAMADDPLLITASSATINYGDTAPAVTPTYSGFVNGDNPSSLTSPPTCSTTVTGIPPAGTYITSCSGADDPNYSIGYAAGTLTVNPAPLQITASSATINYGNTVPAVTPSYSGFVNGDNPSSLSNSPTCSTTAGNSPSAGIYPTTCLGADDPNYSITYVDGTITVGSALLITASSATINYGDTAPAVTPTYSGFVNGDNPSSLTSPPTCSTTVTGIPPAGTYITSCSGADDPNYSIGYAAGTLTVNPAPLQITASSATINYGNTVPAVTPSYSGFVNLDAAASLTTRPTCSTAATSSPAVGTHMTSCSGAADPNYTIGYTAGTLTVIPAPLEITASSGAITYGSPVPAITPSYAGLVNGDSAPATRPTCSTTATHSSPAGTYTTTCSGAVDGNYTIGYSTGVLFIVPPTALPILTVTPDPQTRPFGTANPTFTYAISGFINNQTLATAQVSGTPSCTTTATLFSPAGTYPITCSIGTLTSPFYSFAFVTGTLTITHGVSSVTLSTTTTVFETSTPVTWTAAVEPGVSGATPAGNLVFTIDGVARPAVPLDANGRGAITVTWPTAGRKSVSVSYAGDASFAASGTASASPMVVANTARATGLGVTETTFYPIVDGWRDTVTARGTRLEPLSVSISVKNANGSIVRTFTARTASGPYAWAWNGRTSSGAVLPAGVYTITQTLADPYGSHPSAVKVAKVTLSLRKLTWSTVTVTARPGPRCFQFTSGDGVGAYSCGSTGALGLTGSAGHWPGVGYQFQLPSADAYRSIRVEVIGAFSGGRPTVGFHVWSLGSTWGQLYRPGWGRTAISPTARAWSGVTFTNPGAYISGRSVRVYVDGGGRLGGAFRLSITGIRLVVSVGTLQ
jgi:hypothetical protein